MTIDIAKLRELLQAATPRPWRAGSVEIATLFVPEPNAIGGMERVLCRLNVHEPYVATAPHDARLIAAAVNVLPELLAIAEAAFAARDARGKSTKAADHALWEAVDAARKT